MDFQEYFNKGYAFLEERKFDKALENFELALKFQPNNTEIQQRIDELKIRAKDALMIAELRVDEAKRIAKVMSEFGVELEDVTITNVSKIITDYSNIISDAYYIRGLLFESKEEYARSAEDYSEAIKHNPNSPRNFNKRGYVNLELGNYEQAIEDFMKANLDDAELKQRLASVYMQRGLQYGMKGEYAKSIDDLNEVLKIDPDDIVAREALDLARQASYNLQ